MELLHQIFVGIIKIGEFVLLLESRLLSWYLVSDFLSISYRQAFFWQINSKIGNLFFTISLVLFFLRQLAATFLTRCCHNTRRTFVTDIFDFFFAFLCPFRLLLFIKWCISSFYISFLNEGTFISLVVRWKLNVNLNWRQSEWSGHHFTWVNWCKFREVATLNEVLLHFCNGWTIFKEIFIISVLVGIIYAFVFWRSKDIFRVVSKILLAIWNKAFSFVQILSGVEKLTDAVKLFEFRRLIILRMA